MYNLKCKYMKKNHEPVLFLQIWQKINVEDDALGGFNLFVVFVVCTESGVRANATGFVRREGNPDQTGITAVGE